VIAILELIVDRMLCPPAPNQPVRASVDEVEDQRPGLETDEGRIAIARRAVPGARRVVDFEAVRDGCVIVNQEVR